MRERENLCSSGEEKEEVKKGRLPGKGPLLSLLYVKGAGYMSKSCMQERDR
jgi:hypothetical protein